MDGMNRNRNGSAAITAVVVSYNVASLLQPCLSSLARAAGELRAGGDRLEIVVVDNASTDDSPGMVRRLFPDLRLIQNAANLGFGAACNLGAAAGGAGETGDGSKDEAGDEAG